jgi:hypothetical protein
VISRNRIAALYLFARRKILHADRGWWLFYRILLLLVSFSWLDIDQLHCGLPDPDRPRLLAGDWIKSLLSVLSFYYASQGA